MLFLAHDLFQKQRFFVFECLFSLQNVRRMKARARSCNAFLKLLRFTSVLCLSRALCFPFPDIFIRIETNPCVWKTIWGCKLYKSRSFDILFGLCFLSIPHLCFRPSVSMLIPLSWGNLIHLRKCGSTNLFFRFFSSFLQIKPCS